MDKEDGRRTGEEPALIRVRAASRAAAFLAAACATILVSDAARARDDPAAQGSPTDSYVTDDQRRAVERGLDAIAKMQNPGGSWGEVDGTRIADTALSLLALMAGGNTLGPGVPLDKDGVVSGPTLRGRYAANVQLGIQYLADRALNTPRDQPAGYITDDQNSRMHGHGFATLALATACGSLGSSRFEDIRAAVESGVSPSKLPFADRVRWALEKAVRLTESAQDPDTGGWYYEPHPSAHEGSMTVTQIAALRAASEAGVKVNATVMRRAYDYVRRSQNTSSGELAGGVQYQVNNPERVSYALTAAALTTLFGLGRYGDQPGDADMIERGLSFMDRRFTDEAFSSREKWYYYRLFYAVQALYLSGDERRWQRYWPAIRDEIIGMQRADNDRFRQSKDSDRGPAYCTAMGVLILEVPMETLPIFQRR